MFTFRTKETQILYDKNREEHGPSPFDLSHPLVDYKDWMIIPNAFPYDLVTKKHHLLIPKRKIISFAEMTEAELVELYDIKLKLDQDYNCIIENLPNESSIKDHLHLHLIKWKREFFEGVNDQIKLKKTRQ